MGRRKTQTKTSQKANRRSQWAVALVSACVVICGVVVYQLRRPEEAPQPIRATVFDSFTASHNASLQWGTYRPGLYFGLRTRTAPQHLSTGFMWTSSLSSSGSLRHQCRQEDQLRQYGWLRHNGRDFGQQQILDEENHLRLQTIFLQTNPFHWKSRLLAESTTNNNSSRTHQRVSFFFYVDVGCEDDGREHSCRREIKHSLSPPTMKTNCDSEEDKQCIQLGFQGGVGNSNIEVVEQFNFQFLLRTNQSVKASDLRYAAVSGVNILNVQEKIADLRDKKGDILLDNSFDEDSTIIIIQAVVEMDLEDANPQPQDSFALDVIYSKNNTFLPQHGRFSEEIGAAENTFDDKFEKSFGLSKKNIVGSEKFGKNHIAFAKAAFSNLVGGIGYFNGRSLIRIPNANVLSDPGTLYTAVPSRSFFPRGFLWDEGFHQILVSSFDPEISKDVISHWLNRMSRKSGFIPREQILGYEAESRVPKEFLIQNSYHANPPTLLLAVEKLLLRHNDSNLKTYFHSIYDYLDKWYDWFLKTQRSKSKSQGDKLFQWKGRTLNDGKLNAMTLSSGLDDFPRCSNPSGTEAHVDLLCWMIKGAEIMSKVSDYIDLKEKAVEYDMLKNKLLSQLNFHWNADSKMFNDYGKHSLNGEIQNHVVVRCENPTTGSTLDTTTHVSLLQSRKFSCPRSHSRFLYPLGDGFGNLMMKEKFVPKTVKLQFIPHFGYVSIFPLVLKLLPADSPQLKYTLDKITDSNTLWTKFGILSLSQQDIFYERANEPGDAPYWRGSIWLNINFLAVQAFHYYSKLSGPYQAEFANKYQELRRNLIDNVFSEYERSGYLWEQYNGNVGSKMLGKGQRCHPFSGWTTLVVNIMAEHY